ncbi:hypothetical protein E05_36610 [Plautia stali symbiont]|nr:hypothetical protein E05_36610 [Plautia stali symbiont]
MEKIVIVGGGATGFELSAELYNAVKQLHSYGYKGLDSSALNVTLVEAGERILPALPPRISAAAHQMASRALENILAQRKGKPLKAYVYKDHGSLVSLSRFSTVGSLMGNLMRGSIMVEGRIARFVYISLYRMHQIALHGYFKTGLMMLVGSLNRVLRPRLKLH